LNIEEEVEAMRRKTGSYVNKILVLITILNLFSCCANALELDLSVDEEIRKNYTPSKQERQELPPLPEFGDYKTPSSSGQTLPPPPKIQPANQGTTPPPKTNITTPQKPHVNKVNKNLPGSEVTQNDFTTIKIKKWTKLKLKSNSVVSDYLREGASVKFTTTEPVYQKYVTLPAGTQITAIVTDSHQPQITGNGGLVVLKLETVSFKGRNYSANGKVIKANQKKIFFNNIKGKHKYWAGVAAQVDKGQKFYEKSRKASSKLSNNPFGTILSPIPTIFGTVVYALNFAGSPLLAIPYKGGRISIPAGCEFEIRLLDDVHLSL